MIIRFFDADTGEPPPWPTDPQFIAAGGAATIIDEGSTWEALSGTGSYASLSGYHRTTRRIGHSISAQVEYPIATTRTHQSNAVGDRVMGCVSAPPCRTVRRRCGACVLVAASRCVTLR